MRKHARHYLNCLLLLFISPCISAEVGIAELKGNDLNENYTPEASVSGHVVAGISAAPAGYNGPLVLMSPGDKTNNDICVRMISLDGLYWSKNTFTRITENDSHLIQLKYDSSYPEELFSYEHDELAILSYEGDCDVVKQGPAFIATREIKDKDEFHRPESLTIYINSGRSDTYAIITNKGIPSMTQRCERIKDGRRTGFDTTCVLDLTKIPASINTLNVGIKRRRYERMFPVTYLDIRLPRLEEVKK